MAARIPVLYSFRRCPYAMRARLALAASGQQYELREVVLRDKPQALRDASPKATVPVLVLADGRVVDESLDIMLWALRRHDPQQWLVPAEHNLAAMLALVAQCDETFKYHLDRYKYPQRYTAPRKDGSAPVAAKSASADSAGAQSVAADNTANDNTANDSAANDSTANDSTANDSTAIDPAEHRAAAGRWLLELEGRLEGGFLFGGRAALADMAIAPFVRQYAHVDMHWFAAQPWPRLSAWLAAWMDSDLFNRVMKKYAPWAEGSEKVIGPGR